MPNSIEIKKRSSGIINNASFDGNTTYKINYTANYVILLLIKLYNVKLDILINHKLYVI